MTTRATSLARPSLDGRPLASTTRHDLLVALVHGSCLGAVVPMALDVVEEDPLATAGQFAGDLLRGLMEVPGSYWGRHPRHYARYRAALRAGALRRRLLPIDARMQFWEPLAMLDAPSGERMAPGAPTR
jgi:hypothetical protein